MTVVGTGTISRAQVARLLAEARERTLALIEPLSDEDLRKQHDPLMGPIVWDLGHIAHFEELWLTRNLDGVIEFGEMPGIFNPFEHPRGVRGQLPLPTRSGVVAAMQEIRERVLQRLERAELDSEHPLLHDGYVYHMVAQHEYQHTETILQTLQLKQGEPYTPARRVAPPAASTEIPHDAMLRFPGGDVTVGTDDRAVAYDNERPRHVVTLRPFWIDVTPVRNGQFLEFVEAGGYATRAYWSEAGWRWLTGSEARAPKHWWRERGRWMTRTMDRAAPLAQDHPVCHVNCHEAEAYARFAGKRLPTEDEWEAAASWDPARGEARPYPWGEEAASARTSNVDQLAFGTAPVGAYPVNVSPIGCYGMIGDVWEWTSSDFAPYPGFASFPYREYSDVFFGSEYKVLRGGSWATRPGAIRNTFRNWDFPIRRQIFSGFRCARDD